MIFRNAKDCGHSEGAFHNCGYVAACNRLVGWAAQHASRFAAHGSSAWSTLFHAEMNRLKRAHGLIA